jgi:hypothetical protein
MVYLIQKATKNGWTLARTLYFFKWHYINEYILQIQIVFVTISVPPHCTPCKVNLYHKKHLKNFVVMFDRSKVMVHKQWNRREQLFSFIGRYQTIMNLDICTTAILREKQNEDDNWWQTEVFQQVALITWGIYAFYLFAQKILLSKVTLMIMSTWCI